MEIGRVEWLDLRAVWRNESADFTPWLLRNVDVLRDALGGLDLELERAEHPVGVFSLDLVGSDLTHGCRLVVENQIEASDHGHLGQLLTYAAGSDAGTIVWIAKAFREEHRVALEWLNEHTDEETRFFGVIVRALRIGGSNPALLLEVVARPSDWQKAVRKATVRESEDSLAYRAFWDPLRASLLEERSELLNGRALPKSLWLGIVSPIRKTYLAAEIGSGELRVHLEIDLGDRAANLALLARLREHRDELEAAVGPLDFLEGNFRCKIVRREQWEGQLITQSDRHDAARVWFYEHLLAFRGAMERVAESMPDEPDAASASASASASSL